jgi:hypothetical protein
VTHLIMLLASHTRKGADALHEVADVVIWWHMAALCIDFCSPACLSDSANNELGDGLGMEGKILWFWDRCNSWCNQQSDYVISDSGF